MDPITHVLTGYVVSNVFYNEKYREKKGFYSAVGTATVLTAVSPDVMGTGPLTHGLVFDKLCMWEVLLCREMLVEKVKSRFTISC